MSEKPVAYSQAPAVTAPEPALMLTTGSATNVGGRQENQDAVVSQALAATGDGLAQRVAGQLIAVADGMGGHQHGDQASTLATQTLASVVAGQEAPDAASLLKRAFREANSRIYQAGAASGDVNPMGTTLVAAVVRGKYATIANVGDSRAYLIRANRLNQITQDHSLVAEQVANGEIRPEDARRSPHRNRLTHALGQRERLDNRLPNIFELVLLPDDRLLLCSDGFYDVVPDSDLLAVAVSGSAEVAAATLVDTARQRNTTDNVSAVVLAVDREPITSTTTVSAEQIAPARRTNAVLLTLIVIGVILVIAIIVVALTVL